MRALFAVLLLCILTVGQNYYDERQQVLVKDPIIFGLDLLGWGVDLRLGKPEESIKVPIFKWTYADANKYLYPLEPQTTFTVPDEVYVRTVAEITATNKYFETGQSYVDFLLLRLGVAIEKTSNSSSGSSGNSTGKVNLSAFSGDVGVSYQTTTLNDNKHVLIVNTLESGLWQLVIGPSLVPRERVLGIINDTTVAGTEEAFATFVNRHGTHFIESVIVGGYLEMSSSIRTSSQITNDEISVAANFQFQNAFGLDSGRANIGLNITNTQTYFEKESNNWMKSLGGDPELANFFSGTLRPNETFTLWQETLISNPAVIRFRLREISWLFDSTTRPIVSTVVKKYLNGSLPAFY